MKRIALALLEHLRTRLPGTLLAFIPLALAAALFLPLPASAADAPAACDFHQATLLHSIANGTAYTDRVERRHYRSRNVIEQENLNVEFSLASSFGAAPACVTWTVELRLPDGLAHGSDKSRFAVSAHAAGSRVETTGQLAGDATATFDLHWEELHDEGRTSVASGIRQGDGREARGVFVVSVFANDKDTPLASTGATDPVGRIYFPIVFAASYF